MQVFHHSGPIILATSENGGISLQKTFKAQLLYLMPKKGYTASKLARMTQISVSTISNYLNNKRSIHTNTFEILLNHLLSQPDVPAKQDIKKVQDLI